MSWSELIAQAPPRDPHQAFGDPAQARAALVGLLGEQTIANAVRAYVEGSPQAELARSLLELLAPPAAAEACRALLFDQADVPAPARQAACELLRVVADERALAWAEALIDDEDREVARLAMALVDRLLISGQVAPEQVDALVERAERSRDDGLREQARLTREELQRRRRGRPRAWSPLG